MASNPSEQVVEGKDDRAALKPTPYPVIDADDIDRKLTFSPLADLWHCADARVD